MPEIAYVALVVSASLAFVAWLVIDFYRSYRQDLRSFLPGGGHRDISLELQRVVSLGRDETVPSSIFLRYIGTLAGRLHRRKDDAELFVLGSAVEEAYPPGEPPDDEIWKELRPITATKVANLKEPLTKGGYQVLLLGGELIANLPYLWKTRRQFSASELENNGNRFVSDIKEIAAEFEKEEPDTEKASQLLRNWANEDWPLPDDLLVFALFLKREIAPTYFQSPEAIDKGLLKGWHQSVAKLINDSVPLIERRPTDFPLLMSLLKEYVQVPERVIYDDFRRYRLSEVSVR